MSRVVMLLHNDLSSDTRVMKEAATLAAAGWSVMVVCLRGGGLPDFEQREGYVVRRVADATAASWRSPMRKLAQMRRRERALTEAAIAEQPDVVHCHDTDTLAAGHKVASAIGARLVLDAHELFPDMLAGHGRGSRMVQAYWRHIERTLVPRTDLVITVNDSRARILRERYGVEPLLVQSTPDVEPLAPRAVLRSQLGISESTPIVLYQGGLIAGRSLHRLVGAVALVDGLVLAVQGAGPEEERLREVARERGVDERVRFMGWIQPEKLHAYACGADVGVVIYEPTSLNNFYAAPNKLYAYLMAGLPMVASDFPGLREIVVGEGVGAVFDPMDEESIAGAIRGLLEDPASRARMSEAARALAETRYNWSVDSRQLVGAYERLTGSSS